MAHLPSSRLTLLLLLLLTLTTLAVAWPSLPAMDPVPEAVRAMFDSATPTDSEPFYLTRALAEQADTAAILEASEVKLPGGTPLPAPAYAGFVTVNETYGSNMFYWLFPNPDPSAPVILWLQGGPGGTDMFGLFVEIGPYQLLTNLTIVPRDYTWAKFATLLFIDNPVGTGFSYTESQAGVSTNMDDVAANLYSALSQIFGAYPNLEGNPFYPFCESYGGKYCPAISHYIWKTNKATRARGDDVLINLMGMGVGDGLSDPVSQALGYASLALNFGIVDFPQAATMDTYIAEMLRYINESQWPECSAAFNTLVDGPPDLFQEYSGSPNYFDVRISYNPSYGGDFTTFVNSTAVRAALHVGNHYFQSGNIAAEGLQDDLCKSVKPYLVDLYNDQSFSVATYNGQFDFIVGAPLTEIMLYSFGPSWAQASNWAQAEKVIWRLTPHDVKVAGYVKQLGSFYQIVVRDAGHILPFDQPEVAFNLANNFVNGLPFNG